MTIWPAADDLMPFDLNHRGTRLEGYAECFSPALPRSVARRELDRLGTALGWDGNQLREGPARQNEGPGNALIVTLVHEHLTEVFTGFGEKGVSAEKVAHDLVRELRAYEVGDAALGPHLADQWALPLALSVWKRQRQATYTCTELTPHAKTNFEVIERFLPVRFSASAARKGWLVTVRPA